MIYDSFHQGYVWAGTIHPILLLITLAIIFFITFIPSFIAYSNQHPNRLAILILNIIFGWTGIIWIILLIWALSGRRVP